MKKQDSPWLLVLVVVLTGLLLAQRAQPELVARVHANPWGVDHEGALGTIPVTTSSGTTKVLLVAAPSDPGAMVYLQGQLYCRDTSTTVSHDLTLWSYDGTTYTQIGGVIPLGASSTTSPGGFCEDERGGARHTRPGEALYFSIDNNSGSAADCNVSGSYTVMR